MFFADPKCHEFRLAKVLNTIHYSLSVTENTREIENFRGSYFKNYSTSRQFLSHNQIHEVLKINWKFTKHISIFKQILEGKEEVKWKLQIRDFEIRDRKH